MVSLKYLNNFWRTLEMSLLIYKINFILTCLADCFIIPNPIKNETLTISIADSNFYVPVVTLSTQDNPKLLQQLK